MDCVAGMKLLPDNSIDLTVTSPPYDNLRTYNGNIDQWSFEKFKGIANELYRVTKDGGVIVWIVNDGTKNGSKTGTSFNQALYFKDSGFNLHDIMIWQKPNYAPMYPSVKRYDMNFEFMFILSKGQPKTWNPIKDKPKSEASKQRSKYKTSFIKPDGSRNYKEKTGNDLDYFQSSHFDEPNILVHLRMNTRTDSDGNKVLWQFLQMRNVS